MNLKSSVNGSNWGLAIIDNQLKIVQNNSGQNTQNWYMVAPIQSNGTPVDENSFWLYNASTHQYLSFNKDTKASEAIPALELLSDMPVGVQSARFERVSGTLNGQSVDGLIRGMHSNHANAYLGVTTTSGENNNTVFPAGLIFKWSNGGNDSKIHSFQIVNL